MPLECSPVHVLLHVDLDQRAEHAQHVGIIQQTSVGREEGVLKKIRLVFIGEELQREREREDTSSTNPFLINTYGWLRL